MADEIIKLIEYIINSPYIRAAFIGYIIFAIFIIALVICIFSIVIKRFLRRR